MHPDTVGHLAYLVLLLLAVGGWVIVEYRTRLGVMLRGVLAWGMIFVGLAAAYGLWSDLRTDFVPRQAVFDSGRIEVPRASDGHYYLTLDIAGTPVEFMVDTGASNVVLSSADADRLGIDRSGLVYLGQANTANGTVRTARVRLENVSLGPFRDDRLTAWVTDGDLDMSLLGMDYLDRFRIELDGARMVLTP